MPKLTRLPAPVEKAKAGKLEQISDHYQISMDDGKGVLFVDFSMKENRFGSYDVWVGVNLYGDTKRLYRNGEQILGNPPISSMQVLEALSYLPQHIKRWIPELKNSGNGDNRAEND